MVNPTQVRVSGPLAEFGSGFASELLRQGNKTNPAGLQMNLSRTEILRKILNKTDKKKKTWVVKPGKTPD